MGITGRTAAKKARRIATYLKKVDDYQRQAAALRQARAAYSGVNAATHTITGLGTESSGQQGVLASINTQAGYNLTMARHTGQQYDKMLSHQRRAKKAASKFGLAVKAVAVAAAVWTAGTSLAAANVAAGAGAGAAAGAGAGAAASAGAGAALTTGQQLSLFASSFSDTFAIANTVGGVATGAMSGQVGDENIATQGYAAGYRPYRDYIQGSNLLDQHVRNRNSV